MIKRQFVTSLLASKAGGNLKIVCCLGRIARDIYAFCGEKKKKDIFFSVGAMGSVLPFSFGIALVRKDLKIWAIEGDGSVIMNMGALVTFKRYLTANLTLIILDNKIYETTGGQRSQPENFSLEKVCNSIGLKTISIKNDNELGSFFKDSQKTSQYDVVIIETLPDEVSPRITEWPEQLMLRFKNNLS